MDGKAAARIASKAQPQEGGCVVWIGTTSRKGYGQVWLDGKMQQAHRVVYETIWGPIPPGHMVLHLCDNPSCVNPDHLRTGTARENARDRDRKGRGHYGENHHTAILDPDKVREMRRRYAGGETVAALAREFGLSYTGAAAVVKRQTWKHVS